MGAATETQQMYQVPPPQGSGNLSRRARVLLGVGGVALFGIGAAVGTSGQHATTTIKTVAGPTITKTVKVPSGIKTITKTVKVPGPTVYKTQYVPASQGPTGTTIADYSGSGNQATGTFQAPSSGDYIVKWTYSGNADCSFGTCQGSNFIINDNDTSAEGLGLPNVIGSDGSGSTEVTGASGTESFSVQATGSWTVKVISAS